jgi:hypothetical protein
VLPRLVLAAAAALLLIAAPAGAIVRLPQTLLPVAGNPADRLAGLPIEAFRYDAATRCVNKRRRGMDALSAWLADNTRGVSWGTYRCEKWGKGSASLHAENRALDWHLDARNPADRRAAERLVRLLLAPDRVGNQQALARRMGIEEIIWDCGYWAQGMPAFKPYSVCYTRGGKRRRRVDQTAAHRDHMHIGMTRKGAAGRSTFWTSS